MALEKIRIFCGTLSLHDISININTEYWFSLPFIHLMVSELENKIYASIIKREYRLTTA